MVEIKNIFWYKQRYESKTLLKRIFSEINGKYELRSDDVRLFFLHKRHEMNDVFNIE